MVRKTKAEARLAELTRQLDAKTARWSALGDEIEALLDERKRYAKRHGLALPEEEDNDSSSGTSRLAGRHDTAPEVG